uniref:Uncharacterized protein n=1 Tax=Anguilla anguilla TaxID=7936 RepID=A0A0E9RKD6_ANGAN
MPARGVVMCLEVSVFYFAS